MSTNDMLKLDVIWMTVYVQITLVFFLISIILKFVLSQRQQDFSGIGDLVFTILKFIGYGCLAGFIYFYSVHKGLQQIDVLSFFTFTLATFEAAHCLSIILSLLVHSMVSFFHVVTKER